MSPRKLSIAIVLSLAFLSVTADVDAGVAAGGKTEMVYAVSAHPDDELAAWGAIEHHARAYTVFVIMTQGEQTFSCKTMEESLPPDDEGLGFEDATMLEGLLGHSGREFWDGAHRYQGPSSPVGQPDLGERHPLGTPWVGRGTQACKDARVASWHWFLDDMGGLDPRLGSMEIAGDPYADDDYVGERCHETVGCVKVWATAQGARVAFDLGDSGFTDPTGHQLTPQDVTRALQILRANRASWGLPLLPEAGMVAALRYYDGDDPNCMYYDHLDHRAVYEALFGTDQGTGPQVGPACPTDPRFRNAPSTITPMNPVTLWSANQVDPVTEQRIGAYVVNYGWLFDTYQFQGDPHLLYWRRFS